MDGDSFSLLADIHPLRTRIRASTRMRVFTSAITMLLHGVLLALFITVQKNAFSDSNTSGATRDGSLVMVSLPGETHTNVSPPGSQSRNATREPSFRQAKSPETISTSSASPDSGPAGSSDQQALTLAPSANGKDTGIISEFQRRLFARIETCRQYPATARRARLQGVVELIFAMDRNGIVLGVWIKQSSGYPVLDKEAIATVLRAQPLPAIPAELPDPLNITLPIAFGYPS